MTNATSTISRPAGHGAGLLAVLWTRYVASLASNPVLTKASTSAVLNFLQEAICQAIASPNQPGGKATEKAVKMAVYGFAISGPLGHFLYDALNKLFNGSSLSSMLGQLLGANLAIAPIQNAVYLAAMAIIAGGNVVEDLKRGFMPLMKLTWSIFPIVQLIAVKFLPPDLWLPYFNLVSFVFGIYVNYQVKKAQKRRRYSDAKRKHRGSKCE